MKRFMIFSLGLLLSTATLQAQEDEADSSGLAGDHFSLEGALELFKKAESPEAFEKALNTESNGVNNLDLDGNGETDYISVNDKREGDMHVLVLQVAVNEQEQQDVAVIEIEKDGQESALLQIIGDEELYGEQKIVEPYDEKEKGGKGGPGAYAVSARVLVNVWAWPCVRFMYAPAYVVWTSPWRWHHYPAWWRPWRVSPWHMHHRRCVIYRPHYRVVYTHRVVHAHGIYAPHRRTSHVVHVRYQHVPVHRHGVKGRGQKGGHHGGGGGRRGGGGRGRHR